MRYSFFWFLPLFPNPASRLKSSARIVTHPEDRQSSPPLIIRLAFKFSLSSFIHRFLPFVSPCAKSKSSSEIIPGRSKREAYLYTRGSRFHEAEFTSLH